MQSPDQPPAEEQNNQASPESELEAASFQPLYEFPPATFLPENASGLTTPVSSEAAYPPPPSYYQNMATSSARPTPAQQQPVYPDTQTQQPNSPVMMPPFVPPMPSPTKTSRKWIWIVVSIFAIVLVGSCGLCSWVGYAFFTNTYQQVSGSVYVAVDFYCNIEPQFYSAAYFDVCRLVSIAGL